MGFRTLFLGDIVGKPGKAALRKRLKLIRQESQIDFIVANGENSAGGIGIDLESLSDLLGCGVDFLTLGDHAFNKKDSEELLNKNKHVCIRPANFYDDLGGVGYTIFKHTDGYKIGVINLIGRVFINLPTQCPFRTLDKIINEIKYLCDFIICDFHAEATSEKIALGRYFDGRIDLIVGTHTHVQTNDCKILEKGTAYITDLGMCGTQTSVIGMDSDSAIARLMNGFNHGYKIGIGKEVSINGIIWEFCTENKKSIKIECFSETTCI